VTDKIFLKMFLEVTDVSEGCG